MLQVITERWTGRVNLEEVPPPMLRSGGVLVRTCCTVISPESGRGGEPSGLCGVVMRAWPDSAFRAGQLVACGGIDALQHAEQVWLPDTACAPVSPGIDPADAALAPIGGLALQAVHCCGVKLGDTAVVCGLGLMGLLAVQILRTGGCRVIAVDPDAECCAQAQVCGADLGLVYGRDDVPGTVQTITGGAGAAAVLVFSGTYASGLAAALCRRGGRVLISGSLPIRGSAQPYGEKELELRIFAATTGADSTAAFLDLLAANRVQPARIAARRFPVTDAALAYAAAEQALSGRPEESAAFPPALLLEFPRETPLSPTLVLPAAVRGLRSGELGLALVDLDAAAREVTLPALARIEGVKVRAVTGTDGRATRQVAERYGAAYCTADLEAVLSDSQIHALLVFSGHPSQAVVAQQALAAGKHVYLAQPLVTGRTELYALARARRHAEQVLWAGFSRRYAPLVTRLAERLGTRSGPLTLHYRIIAPARPEEERGRGPEPAPRLIADLCQHVDLALLLIGARRVAVRAAGAPAARGQAAENLQVLLAGEDGSVAGLLHTRVDARLRPRERLEVFRGGAAGVIEDFGGLTWAQEGRVHRFRQGAGNWGHREELRQFVRAVRAGGDDGFGFGALALATTLAVLDCLRTGQEQRAELGQI